jgi:hypothetical protein
MIMFRNIIVNRKGSTINSFMKTNRIIQTIYPNVNYKILQHCLIPLSEYNLEHLDKNIIKEPRFTEIDSNWIDDNSIKLANSNILGSFGRLTVPPEIIIPVNIADYNNVKFYGAKLYRLFDIIKFETKEVLPLTEMIIGKDYVNHYILKKDLGGGQYLEYHDNPHFHSPLNTDNKGYIILGKIENFKLKLSAFIIPYYTALYTPGFVIHNDANLVGRWLVVYSKTDNYSTVLLRDKNDNCSKIHFELK